MSSTRIQILGYQMLMTAVVAGLGVCLIVAGTVNVWLSALAWPFAQVQGFAARKIKALR
jgi:hypothetical protein